MGVKATFMRVMREKHELEKIMGQPVPMGVAGLVRLADGTVEFQMRVETAPGVWRVDFRRPVPPKRPVNGERVQEVRGRTERVVYLDDFNFRDFRVLP